MNKCMGADNSRVSFYRLSTKLSLKFEEVTEKSNINIAFNIMYNQHSVIFLRVSMLFISIKHQTKPSNHLQSRLNLYFPPSLSQGAEAQVHKRSQREVQAPRVREQGDERCRLLQVLKARPESVLWICMCGGVCGIAPLCTARVPIPILIRDAESVSTGEV